MSTATDLADLEAMIAENELGDDEAEALKEAAQAGASLNDALAFVLSQREAGGDRNEEPPAPPEELGEPTDAQLKALEKQLERHVAKVRQIMGGHVAGFDTCETCGALGLVPPGPRPQENENFKACDTCAGFGEVKTGSIRAGHQSRDCPTCRGRGYLERLDGPQIATAQPFVADPAPFVPTPQSEELSPPPAAPPTPPVDQWGVPAWMGDPSLSR